jgi:hypothetical protein
MHKQMDELERYNLLDLQCWEWREPLAAIPHTSNKDVAQIARDMGLPYSVMKAILNLLGLGRYVHLELKEDAYEYRIKDERTLNKL